MLCTLQLVEPESHQALVTMQGEAAPGPAGTFCRVSWWGLMHAKGTPRCQLLPSWVHTPFRRPAAARGRLLQPCSGRRPLRERPST